MSSSNVPPVTNSKSSDYLSNSSDKCLNNKRASSSTCLKPKRSSGLLAAFVRRKKGKTKPTESPSRITLIADESNFTIHSNEHIAISLQNYERHNDGRVEQSDANDNSKTNLMYTTSEHCVQEQQRSKHQFFSKFKSRSSQEDPKLKYDRTLAVQASMMDMGCTSRTYLHHQMQAQSGDNRPRQSTPSTDPNYPLWTSYMGFDKPLLNPTLANGLHYIQDLADRLVESENHFIQIFSRYIQDTSLRRELLDALNQHAKLQWETERRTSSLANDMWLHQIEIGRAQERTLQETLNNLVKQNRQLQIDNEVLYKKNEKLMMQTRSKGTLECDVYSDQLAKQNEKLRYKLESYLAQIDHLESELHILQKENDDLEEQLRGASSQIHNLKGIFERAKTDYELEIVEINYSLVQSEGMIKDVAKAGDVFLQDLDAVKRQIASHCLTVNLDSFRCHGNDLTDLVHLARICINELSKEMFNLHNQLNLKEKDIQNLQETNTKLQENLRKSSVELDRLSKKIDEGSVKDADKMIWEQKCKLLETDLKIIEEKMENLNMKHDNEKATLLSRINELTTTNKELSEKEKLIEQTKLYVSSITSENLALRQQLDGLSKVLSETGAGDVFKEMSHNQEQLTYFQSQYYQLLNEKQTLLDQNSLLRTENKTILQQQEEHCKVLQSQLKDFEAISNENKYLKQKLDQEKQIVAGLQNERSKYIEEKNLLKTVFHRMKAELTRVSQLEGTVADMGQEAKKLALIAEYNKQVGDKLKTEIEERDKTILKLRNSVEKLNEVQIKNTKEKLSLCYELSEVCQVKEQLSNILSMEVQKNAALDDSKKELAQTASTQIKRIAEQQRSERSAIKDLLKDLRAVSDERDKLAKENNKINEEFTELRKANKDLQKTLDDIVLAKKELEQKVKDLTTKLEESRENALAMQDRMNSDIAKYTETVRKMEKMLIQNRTISDQLKSEKEKLDNSVKYLQNNTAKLHQDLNESRKNEKDLKDALNEYFTEKEQLVKEKQELQNQLVRLATENDKLSEELANLNNLCEKVIREYESNLKGSMDKEDTYRKEFEEAKKLVLSSSQEAERLANILCEKQDELKSLYDENEMYRKRERTYIESVKSLENHKQQNMELTNKNIKLESDLSELNDECNQLKQQADAMFREIQNLQNQMVVAMTNKEEECIFFKMHVDEALRENTEAQEKNRMEISKLKLELDDLSQQLENERSAYSALSQVHKEISAKLVKSIKDLVDERNEKQDLFNERQRTEAELTRLKSEKADLQQQVNVLLDGLNESKNRINTLAQEKETIQNAFDDLQKRYNDVLQKCLSLENQVRLTDVKRTDAHTSCGVEQAALKEQVDILKKGFEENNDTILSLKQGINKLQQQITSLEFQKSEVTLRLHEMQRRFETEQKVCGKLQSTHKLVLESLMKMKEDGKVEGSDCSLLMQLVQNNGPSSVSESEMDVSS